VVSNSKEAAQERANQELRDKYWLCIFCRQHHIADDVASLPICWYKKHLKALAMLLSELKRQPIGQWHHDTDLCCWVGSMNTLQSGSVDRGVGTVSPRTSE